MTTRRHFFRGVALGAGGTLLTSLANRIEATESGKPIPPRFLFLVEGNGMAPSTIQPKEIKLPGRGKRPQYREESIVDKTLPEGIEPLSPWKSKMAILQGLSGRVAGGGHSNDFGALGAYHAKGGVGNSGFPVDHTIDAAIAKVAPGIFPVVGLGISDRPEHTIIYNASAWGAGQKMPTQCRPDLAYGSLFGSVADGDGAKAFHARGSLLDFMVDDIKRVEMRLNSREKGKLDSYLQAYENLKNRQKRLVQTRDKLRRAAPMVADKYVSEVETDRLDAQFELAAASLIGGLSNVATVASGVGNPYFSVKFNGLGIEIGKHGIGHGGSFQNWTAADMTNMIRRFHCQLLARTIKQLEAIPEGDGTMFDNTTIVYLSDAAEGHHSRCWEWPFVVIGNAGGRLKVDGRCMMFPDYGSDGHKTINNLYCTFLHAAGRSVDQFGQSDQMLRDLDLSGPLSELMG